MADYYEKFKGSDAEVVSVSTDTRYVYKAWHEENDLVNEVQYPMLADPTGMMSRKFGTYNEESGLSFLCTFIIDPDGKVQSKMIYCEDIGRSAKEILRQLKAVKFVREHEGKMCPASWEPGEETLDKDH